MNRYKVAERIRESLHNSRDCARHTARRCVDFFAKQRKAANTLRLQFFAAMSAVMKKLLQKIIACMKWICLAVRWIGRVAIWSMVAGSALLLFYIHPGLRAAALIPIIILFPYWLIAKIIFKLTYGSDLSIRMAWDRLRSKAYADIKSVAAGLLWYAVFFCLVSIYFTFLVVGPVTFSTYLLLRPSNLEEALHLIRGSTPPDASLFHLLLKYYFVAAGCFTVGAMFYFLRSIRRTGYAVLEIAIGVILVSANFDTLFTLLGYFLAFDKGLVDWLLHDADQTALLSIAGGFYVIVRGMDNLEKGVRPETPAGVFLTKLPKEVEKQVDDHYEMILLSMKAMIGRAK